MKIDTFICTFCEGHIPRPLENWGTYDFPMCLQCYLSMAGEIGPDPFYGYAPAGEQKPGEVLGDVDLAWATFSPDAECPGMGVYYPKP